MAEKQESFKMTYKELKNKIKEEQKTLAQKIRDLKGTRKKVTSGYVEGLESRQSDYRHAHIMYCYFFNNTPYEKIEQPREGNNPSSWKLEHYKKQWESELDEAIHNCA